MWSVSLGNRGCTDPGEVDDDSISRDSGTWREHDSIMRMVLKNGYIAWNHENTRGIDINRRIPPPSRQTRIRCIPSPFFSFSGEEKETSFHFFLKMKRTQIGVDK